MAEKTEKKSTAKKGRPRHNLVKCKVPNVWTSKGKILKGESITLPPEEVADLKKKKMVE